MAGGVVRCGLNGERDEEWQNTRERKVRGSVAGCVKGGNFAREGCEVDDGKAQ